MILKTLIVGAMEVNCYILASHRNSPAIIIDPGDDETKIRQVLESYILKPAFVINTHGHFDHIGCDDKFAVPVYVYSQDEELLKDAKSNFSSFLGSAYKVKSEIKTLKDREIIKLQDIELQVIHTPGHTAGSISFLMRKPKDNILFTGDTLFYRGIGRTDLGGDEEVLMRSIREKLFILPDNTIIYPGHGPSSTIGEEKRNNQYLYY
jgi:glyoxylase-like metal-dependent hydrolase (beta-lactamase superfamily II)